MFPRFTVYSLLRSKEPVRFLCEWEELHNPDFNRVEFDIQTDTDYEIKISFALIANLKNIGRNI